MHRFYVHESDLRQSEYKPADIKTAVYLAYDVDLNNAGYEQQIGDGERRIAELEGALEAVMADRPGSYEMGIRALLRR